MPMIFNIKKIKGLLLGGTLLVFLFSFTLLFVSKKETMHQQYNRNFKRQWEDLHLVLQQSIQQDIDIERLATDGNDIIIYDMKANRLLRLDKDGKTVNTYGKAGKVLGEFQLVEGLSADSAGIYTTDPKNRQVIQWEKTGAIRASFQAEKFGRAAHIEGSHFIFKLADAQLQDDVFAITDISGQRKKLLTGALPVFGDRGIANDGFFVNNGHGKAFHISYYTKNFYCFDTSGVVYKAATVDNNNTPPRAVKGSNFYSPPADVVEVNREAAADKNFLYIRSNIRSDFDDERRVYEGSIIDVYAVNDGRYLYSFSIPDIDDKKVDYLSISPDRIITVQGGKLNFFTYERKLKI